MSKVYKTNITKGYCFQWSISKSCMEFISNALDEGGYDIQTDTENGVLEVTNFNVKLDPKVLMLGLSSKRGDDTKRGMFGCGVAMAIAALLDQDCNVTIYNTDIIWECSFDHCQEWDYEVLTFKERPNPSPTSDLTIVVSGMESSDVEEITQRTLVLQDREVLFSTPYGDVIENGDDQGEVFCGDMYVCENNGFKYSYNFKPKVLPLNQDRNAVNNWDLKVLTAKIWKACPDKDLLMEAIKSKTEDCYLVMENFWTDTSGKLSISDELGEDYVKKNPNTLLTSDFSEYENLLKCGNKVTLIDNSNEVKSIKESDAYKTMISNLTIIEEESKETRLHTIREALQSYVDDHSGNDEEYEGKTLQDHLDELESIIDNEIY